MPHRRRKTSTLRALIPTFALLTVGLVGLPLVNAPAWAEQADASQALELPEGALAPYRENTRFNARSLADDRVRGVVVYFTADTLTLTDDRQQQTVNWADFDPKLVSRYVGRLVQANDARGQLTIAQIMANVGGDAALIERSLKRAEELDPDLAQAAQAIRDQAPAEPDAGEVGQPSEGGADTQGDRPGGHAPEPVIDNPRAWPEMTDQQHAQAIQTIESNTEAVLEKMNKRMGHIQTERFIVYTDLERREAQYWIGLLDKMYDRMCEVFDLDKEANIWKGKCLLMLFRNQRDYLLYNATAYGNNATGSAGICYQFGQGDVHIAMFRQQREKELAHVLVHEASHGFLFRYQSSYHIPSWLNEGLAEYIATALVDSGSSDLRAQRARQFVRQRKSLDNFLSAGNIIGQHYGLAYDITDLMVAENRRGYVKLIQGLKEGKSVEEAFKDNYGAKLDRVLMYYLDTRVRDTDIRLR